MGIVIKGGSTKVTGQGSTNTGPRIPIEGLIMVIDPALAQTTSSAYRLITPLTSSILTATTSKICVSHRGRPICVCEYEFSSHYQYPRSTKYVL